MPDGFLGAPTSLAAAVAVGGVGVLLRHREELAERGPGAGRLTAAFVFAAQLVNVPVAAGTGGHLLGGALAAVLVGPWLAVPASPSSWCSRCLLFADGGLSALGINVVNMALVTCLGAWVVFRAVRASVLPLGPLAPARRRAGRVLPWCSRPWPSPRSSPWAARPQCRCGRCSPPWCRCTYSLASARRPDRTGGRGGPGPPARPRRRRPDGPGRPGCAVLVPLGLSLATAVAVGAVTVGQHRARRPRAGGGDLGIVAAPAAIGSAVLGSDLAGSLARVAVAFGWWHSSPAG